MSHTLLPLPRQNEELQQSLLKRIVGGSWTGPYEKPTVIYDTQLEKCFVTSKDMLALWRGGYYGKGSLSRSDPTWYARWPALMKSHSETQAQEARSLEQITAERRQRRNEYKIQKFEERKQQRIKEAREYHELHGEPSHGLHLDNVDAVGNGHILYAPTEEDSTLAAESKSPTFSQKSPTFTDVESYASARESGAEDSDSLSDSLHSVEDEPVVYDDIAPRTGEILGLDFESVFFLKFAFNAVNVYEGSVFQETRSAMPLSTHVLWRIFLSAHPVLAPSPQSPIDRWDNPFLVSYAVYHHFRSQGWVVRSGIKFSTDWLLYAPVGPAGMHAEFGVLIIKHYENASDKDTCPFVHSQYTSEGESRTSIRWFHSVNRILAGVKKNLVLTHVTLPPLADLPAQDWIATHPYEALRAIQVRHFVFRRWHPGRTRD